ncbi:MAG: hypothetical protein LBS82_01340 [Spirochaetaceae bacterium]|jgi:hypothetical protein|nr:hypothetical protein [Spirochaetaceae bacterium]
MDTLSAIVALLKELGTPAITVIGFAWVIFKLKKLSSAVLELKMDVKSVKNNHLPHIEAAINELAKGTPNEAHVKAILDLSHKADLG